MTKHRLKTSPFWALATVAALGMGLSACGGGGDSDDMSGEPLAPPPTYTVALPDGHGLSVGRTTLRQGDTVVGDTTISCPTADGCMLTVSRDPVTGAWTATATGGAVTVAVAEPPPVDPGPDPVQIADAQEAARDAWRDARATLAGLAGKQNANPAAYQRAVDAVADAKSAYDAALMAMTVAEAMRHQEDAEAANDMATAQAAAVIASHDAPAIDDARMAAMKAANDAKTAYEDAKAAVAAVEAIKAIDMDSYDTAADKEADAKAAYEAAKMAADAAKMGTLLADVEAQRDAAQGASEDASTANTDAMKYAGMVQAAETSELTSAKSDAQTAYNAAKMAYETAKMRVDALSTENDDGRAKKDDNVADHVRATDALAEVKDTYDDAAAANAMAQAATLSTTAREHANDVETHKDAVDTEKADVDRYAGLVETAYMAAQRQRNTDEQNRMDEEQRKKDVASARMAAMQSYDAAKADAEKAEAEAEAAEATAPGSPGAMAAKGAATKARMAADDAKAAHEAITDDMTKEQADAKASDAATAAGTANTQYAAAKEQNGAIQTGHQIAQETQRKSGIAAATKAADRAVEAAKTAMDDAAKAATAAENARDNAEDDYEKAMAARTDSAKAKSEYEKAKTAAAAARKLATDAETAYMDAKEAADGIDDAGTVAAAETARETAEKESGKAVTAANTAAVHQKTAMTAMNDAETAAGSHVLTLFQAANGAHVMDVETTMNVNEKAAHVTSVGNAMAAIANADAGNQAASTTASATYPGDTVDNPVTAGTDESAEGMFSFTVNVAGTTSITSELRASRVATDLNNDGDTTGDGEARIIQTAMKIADLGVFQGYDLWEDDGNANTGEFMDRARAIVFTNKQQGDDSKLARVGGGARSVNSQTVTADQLSTVTSTGNTITGVTWTPSGEAPLTGTLTCGDDACNIVLGDDGAVTTINGYTFAGSRAAVEAVTAAAATEDNDYLIFGLWLEESDDGATDTFGAFASGGTDYAVNVQNAVTGTANYNGKAAGAHHKTGEGVNWFEGDAGLTANFGTATADGSISGSISGIRVNGGETMSTPIYLGQADLTDGTATFNGAAFMGAATAPGADTHEFDGTWSGSFFGATENDADTADVDESVTAPLAAAGTFGVTKSEGTGDDMVVESFVGAFGAHKQ